MKEKYILQGVGLAVLTTIIWSGNFIVARAVYQEIPPISLAFFRWGLAVLIFLPFALKGFIRDWPVIRKNIHYLFWVALSGMALFNTFIYVAGHYTSAINLALIGTTSSPVMSNIMARIFLKEKIGWQKIIGMVICIVGILYLICKGSFSNLANFQFSKGDAWVLLSAFSFAVYNVLVKRKPVALAPVSFLFSVILFGSLLLVPLFFWERTYAPPVVWSVHLGWVILYLGVGASVISYLLWNKSIQLLGAGRASLFGNLIPIFSSLEAVFILHEAFTVHHVISMILVFLGLLIANLSLFSDSRPRRSVTA